MAFLVFILGAIAAYFIWKYLSKKMIEKGNGKVISNLLGVVVGFLIWTVIIIVATASKYKDADPTKHGYKTITTVKADDNVNAENLSEKMIKSISSDIVSASVQMQYAGDHKGKNNIDIEIESSSWSGVQAWNSVALKSFNISKKLFIRNDIGKITFVVWNADHSNTWTRVEIIRKLLPDKWVELTYLQFFSYAKLDIFTAQGEEWLNEFYAEYSSAVPK